MNARKILTTVYAISQTNPTFLDRINGTFETERIPCEWLGEDESGM
jgi:hypothetical protein